MVLLMPGELLPCAEVPFDDGDDGVVHGHPAIYDTVLPTTIILEVSTTTNDYPYCEELYFIYCWEVKSFPQRSFPHLQVPCIDAESCSWLGLQGFKNVNEIVLFSFWYWADLPNNVKSYHRDSFNFWIHEVCHPLIVRHVVVVDQAEVHNDVPIILIGVYLMHREERVSLCCLNLSCVEVDNVEGGAAALVPAEKFKQVEIIDPVGPEINLNNSLESDQGL